MCTRSIYGPRRLLRGGGGGANNKGTDQPAQSGQRLCHSVIGKYHIQTCYTQIFNVLDSLCS